MKKIFDQNQIRSMIENQSLSLSEVARQLDTKVSIISNFCKRNSIISKHATAAVVKPIPIQNIYVKYLDGISLDALHKEYQIPVARIKRHLLHYRPDIKFRTMDEAKRPKELNDPTLLQELANNYSFRQIAKTLGVKANTVCNAASKFNIKSNFSLTSADIPTNVLSQLYNKDKMTPRQIAEHTGQTYGAILRKLRRQQFIINKPGGTQRLSKYPQLNDKAWLYDQYITKQRGAGDIALELNISIGNIMHFLKKHNIEPRSKSEYLSLLVNRTHGCKLIRDGIKYDSQLEVDYVNKTQCKIIKRNAELGANGSLCYIDFLLDNGEYIEIKSAERSEKPGPDRRRLVKQKLICDRNNIQLKIWNGEYYQLDIDDIDKYYCLNWRLIFSTPDECVKWLLDYGYHDLRFSLFELDNAFKWLEIPKKEELNANWQNAAVVNLIQHFSPHFWYSHHKGYLPITAAWGKGNQTILISAVNSLWEQKKEVSIYGLMKHIDKIYKDFKSASVFKPWVAKTIYRKYLPKGGVIVDPCMGWGGRLLGCVNGNYDYIGYDLNQLAVNSHAALLKFITPRLKPNGNYQFIQADSSTTKFVQGDLLLTSPPYDDCEYYHGIDSSATKTQPILENILAHFEGIIALNLPKRQEAMCMSVAAKYNRQLIDRLEMKTAGFMGKRVSTYEPILIFKAK